MARLAALQAGAARGDARPAPLTPRRAGWSAPPGAAPETRPAGPAPSRRGLAAFRPGAAGFRAAAPPAPPAARAAEAWDRRPASAAFAICSFGGPFLASHLRRACACSGSCLSANRPPRIDGCYPARPVRPLATRQRRPGRRAPPDQRVPASRGANGFPLPAQAAARRPAALPPAPTPFGRGRSARPQGAAPRRGPSVRPRPNEQRPGKDPA